MEAPHKLGLQLAVVPEENMFENVDNRHTADDGCLPILYAHQCAFSSGELTLHYVVSISNNEQKQQMYAIKNSLT